MPPALTQAPAETPPSAAAAGFVLARHSSGQRCPAPCLCVVDISASQFTGPLTYRNAKGRSHEARRKKEILVQIRLDTTTTTTTVTASITAPRTKKEGRQAKARSTNWYIPARGSHSNPRRATPLPTFCRAICPPRQPKTQGPPQQFASLDLLASSQPETSAIQRCGFWLHSTISRALSWTRVNATSPDPGHWASSATVGRLVEFALLCFSRLCPGDEYPQSSFCPESFGSGVPQPAFPAPAPAPTPTLHAPVSSQSPRRLTKNKSQPRPRRNPLPASRPAPPRGSLSLAHRTPDLTHTPPALPGIICFFASSPLFISPRRPLPVSTPHPQSSPESVVTSCPGPVYRPHSWLPEFLHHGT